MSGLTDTILGLLPVWGPWLLALTTFLSCLALPIPASLLMIAGGAFVASGDLSPVWAILGALTGAIVGDQLGYLLGRGAGAFLERRLPKRSLLHARTKLKSSGTQAIFLSRWLFSALGPSMNLVAGVISFPRKRFTIAAIAGEVVWVVSYLGIGIVFGSNIEAAAELASNALGLLATGTIAILLGRWLWKRARDGAPKSRPVYEASTSSFPKTLPATRSSRD